LALYAEKLRQQHPETAAIYDRFVERLAVAGAGAEAPRPGEPMPPFLLPDDGGHLVGLPQLLAAGPLVLSLNRGHWCPFCKLELRALAEQAPQIAEAGGQIVSLTPERQSFAHRLRTEEQLPFAVLCDLDHAYALSLGLMVWLGGELIALYKQLALELPSYQGNDGWFIPIPATFVIGRNGLVIDRQAHPDFRRRMEISTILQALAQHR
jgi:peroxiredoxin